MSKIDYQALREAAENYQSTLAWYQEKPDSPNAEQDCDAALAAFKREIRHREVDIIAGLLDELDEKQQYIKLRDQENEDIALTVGKLRVELEETKSKLNEQRVYYEGVISDGSKRIAELESDSQAQKLVEAIIVAIENEQERLFDEDYLMDSKECIDVIREEVKRWNDSRAAGIKEESE
ncbi:TPA: ead/Ea22-like family protein [Escherichia coli]|nr:ead/Ea22-like family protein [Escherichia coli]HEA6298111.1 ead/Ea22-like family protein [Escherichia coli]